MKKIFAFLTVSLLCVTFGFNLANSTTSTGMSGNVHDEDGMPIILANVVVSPKLGTTTDFSGDFELLCPPKISYKVVVSCVGYISDTLDVPVCRGVMTRVSVTLKEAKGNE